MLAEMNVSGDLAALLLQFIEQKQIDAEQLKKQLGHYQAASRMTFRSWWAFLEQLQAMLPGEPVGLELGASITPAHLGVLGYLTLSCDSVAEALQRFERYQRLLHDGETATVLLMEEEVAICWDNRFGPSTQLSDEVLIMGMVKSLRMMTGDATVQPSRVQFVGKQTDIQVDYRRWLDCPLAFEQPQLRLYLPLAYLKYPVSNSDPALKRLLELQAQSLLDVIPRQEIFYQQLQQAVVKAIESGLPTQEQGASLMALSRRTLHRRLHEQGMEFREILQQTRLQLAKQYLAQRQLTLAEIALLLGYSEQSAFSRAFRQWSGFTPLQYQKKALADCRER